jgi:hypothetical protein
VAARVFPSRGAPQGGVEFPGGPVSMEDVI